MKYIIELEDKPINGLYRAKAFRTLVFDEEGIRRLKPLAYDPVEYYEKGKRDGMLLLKEKIKGAMKINLNKLIDEVPKGWL